MSSRLALHFLGSPQLYLDNELILVERRKVVALLAYLAMERGQHRRESLSALLWPDYEQSKAFTNLRHTLWEIQKSIGEGWLITDRERIGLNEAADVWLDVRQFESLMAQSQAQDDASLRIPLLSDSIKLYRNHFLTGFSLKDSPNFNEWAFAESEDWRCQFAGALISLSEDYCVLGQAENAIPYARRLITLDPLNESAHRRLMEVYVQAGQPSAALKQYQICEETLRKELNADPQPETYALYKQIRKREIKPVQVTKTSETGVSRHILPHQLSSFIGREKEQKEIADLIANHRLVTLTGAGGIGKTRLSIQAANELFDQYSDGVWLVELAPILDPVLIPRTTAIAIGLRDEPQRPIIDMLCDYLREKRMLILLDNCEHLVEACARMADRVLHAAPKVRILATSREALGIAGEVIYYVPSLGLPDIQHLPAVESLSQYEAVQLFMDRATSAVPTFTITNENAPSLAQICCRLDGIPLAIELAAAKVRVLSVRQIAERLDDRFHLLTGGSRTALERHQTLRAAIDWSYNLLSPAEQALFRRLSVFVGGWRLEAVESVCSDESVSSVVRTKDVLNLLEQLISKSLVRKEEIQSETRYHMLETLRQYANGKLVESGERDELRDRHLEYFLNLAETAAPHLIQPEQLQWLAQLDANYENIRASLEWALNKESAESSLRLCAALGMFWDIRNYWLEGSKYLGRALAKPAQSSDNSEQRARVKALYWDADLAQSLDDLKRAKASAELSLALARQRSDKRDIAIAGFFKGFVLYRCGDDNSARLLMENSFGTFKELDDPFWESWSYNMLGRILVHLGELKPSERITRRLKPARKAGERIQLADALFVYSIWHFTYGRMDEARKCAEEADMLWKEIGSNVNSTSLVYALIAWSNGDYARARSYYAGMRERFDLLGEKNMRSTLTASLGLLAMEEGNLIHAQEYLEEALTSARDLENKPYIAYWLVELGNLFYLQGNIDKYKQNLRESILLASSLTKYPKINLLVSILNSVAIQRYVDAARLLGAVRGFERENERPIRIHQKHLSYELFTAHAREAFGDAVFESAFAEGEKMSLDAALDLALKMVEEM